MKILLLVANCQIQYLKDVIHIIRQVLEDLDIEIEIKELFNLPYFKYEKTKIMDEIVQSIENSRGVIALCPVHMLGMHGAMQSFFDHATLYDDFKKPLLAITYSEWLGENEVADKMLRNWHVLGGISTGKLCLNNSVSVLLIQERIEKVVEDFYRTLKQERIEILSTERIVYKTAKESMNTKAESKINVEDIPEEAPQEIKVQEQNIRELTSLLKGQLGKREYSEEKSIVKDISKAFYNKPTSKNWEKNGITKRLDQIPHYFIASHDRSLDMTIQYIITDTKETGYVVIKNGECSYVEGIKESPTVELTITHPVMMDIISKKTTYQKAFMVGNLKVRGNFAILSKLDQIFTGA